MNNSEAINIEEIEDINRLATDNLSSNYTTQECEKPIKLENPETESGKSNEEDLNCTIKQLKNKLERKSNSARSLRLNLNKKKKEIKELVIEKNKLEREKGKLSDAVLLLKDENKKLKAQLKEYEKKILDLNEEVDNTMEHLNYCSAELRKYKDVESLLPKSNFGNKISHIKKTTIYEMMNVIYSLLSKKS